MAKLKPAERIPKEMQRRYAQIARLLEAFSHRHLNDEYCELLLQALSKLCRKRPSPVAKGWAETWAAGIVHAVGTANFIFDRKSEFYIPADTIAEFFNVSKSTSSNKANEIRKMLKISYDNFEWVLPSHQYENPMIWLISVDGYIMDARYLSLQDQIICYEKGLIPYVPLLSSYPLPMEEDWEEDSADPTSEEPGC